MSSLQAHLRQAQHNESLALQLVTDLNYKDWAVTVTFYAALHYVEAAFARDPRIRHTETSKPYDFKGSFHDYREEFLRDHYPKEEVWKPFSKLRKLSFTARYLNTTDKRQFLRMTVQEYFGDEDVKAFLQKDLGIIRQTLGFV